MVTAIEETQKQFKKRDTLVEQEVAKQQQWEDQRVFEADAPLPNEPHVDKFMVSFPYPYMNGLLHLGHGFTLTKPDFAVGFQRLKGKRCLYPFGFHCTGMPIKAAADKLKREIAMFGDDFNGFEERESGEIETPQPAIAGKKKHGKLNAKSTGLTYQFQIMRAMGVKEQEIKLFVDPLHWLTYFPPLTITDLKRLGLHVDWRRSFITTDVNPYYDSFVRWQFNRLHDLLPSKVLFGERYTIYSPLDGQPCMDHDRSSGEGVGVQDYTAIKLRVKHELLSPSVSDAVRQLCKSTLGNRKLFLVAATLRPETMYGQTNCFVGVDIEYGVYQVSDTEAWVCSERSARNMAFQSLFEEKGKLVKLATLKGSDLVGLPLSAPLCQFETVYTLPMEGVIATKGTGVVTSVPSDSPDDYITMQDLSKKAEYYKIQKAWVDPFLPPKPIIRTPNFGDLAAAAAIEKLKIKSQKDTKQLAEAKEMVYKEGFYHGTMVVGEYTGRPVQEAKPLIRQKLIDQGDAFPYCEPEGLVISRSGDECVVTLAAQWYMDYGEDSWKKLAIECLDGLNTYHDETRHAFRKTLDWLNQWACSRSFGLGSRLPWDKEWLIESLSDSTIYMAYYTVAHILQQGSLDGSKPGPGNIKPEQMTDAVWSYIMLGAEYPKDSKIPKETLEKLRREFNYFYPLDLRCSGKDLINNHLTFFLYNHTAVFPKDKWPKGIRANGHLLINNEKMSKSTGNFMMLREALDKYGSDAVRFALADAGDSVEDANFVEKTADDAILKLFTEREWIEETLNRTDLRKGPLSWYDRLFIAEMDRIIRLGDAAYENMLFREAVRLCFYDLQTARNEYRKAVIPAGNSDPSEVFELFHKDVVRRYIEVQAVIMSPIIPHWSEYIWQDALKQTSSILNARWPETRQEDLSILAAGAYIRDVVSKIRSTEDALAKKKAKKGGATTTTLGDEPKTLYLYIALAFPDWQTQTVDILKKAWDEKTESFTGSEKELFAAAGLMKDKRTMPFAQTIKKLVETNGSKSFDRCLLFAEYETLENNKDYVRRELSGLKVCGIKLIKKEEIVIGQDGMTDEDFKKADFALPGIPTYRLV